MQESDTLNSEAVNRFLSLDISRKEELRGIVALVAEICDAEYSTLMLTNGQPQQLQYKASNMLPDLSSEHSFCINYNRKQATFVVPDVREEEQYKHNPMVYGEPFIRFYAATPLYTGNRVAIGCLCVFGLQPHGLDQKQFKVLEALGNQVVNLIEFDYGQSLLNKQYERLQSSEILLKTFFESSQNSFLLLGKKLEVLAFNKAASDFVETMFGLEIKKGLTITDYMNPAYNEEFVSCYNKAMTGVPVQIERKLAYKNDIEIWWFCSFSPALDEFGDIIGVAYNEANISDRKKQEKTIRDKNEALRRIAFLQSHELRAPLANIKGLLNIMQLENYNNIISYLHLMEGQVEKMDNKIKDIIDHTTV